MKRRFEVSFDMYHNVGEMSESAALMLTERVRASRVGDIARENLRIMDTSADEGVVRVEPRHAATMASSLLSGDDESVVSARLIEDRNEMEIVRRTRSNLVLASFPGKPTPDEVWKEVYGVVDGKITLVRKVKGVHQPAELRDEVISFPKEG